MGILLEDIESARQFCPSQGSAGFQYDNRDARKCIKKAAFADLRSACLRVSSELTAPFLRLEKEIDDFSSHQSKSYPELERQLDCLKNEATRLRDEAAKRRQDLLAKTAPH